MANWITLLDCTQCIGRVSAERGFVCPEIVSESSSIDIVQLRHPLVESTKSRVSYVKHDVSLSDETNGWLVYGMNASGKSTLMKATGICIILAQAGCFVPAKSMRLSPFKAIYTRILNQDNLFAGLSTFAVEMSELRDILRNATSQTLVLGDELCSGTESISAQALVSSGIQWLTKRNAKFIFATHLHDLPQLIEDVAERVAVWHLHVEYNPVTQKLIYDRSLRRGNGSTLYGLEVARAMDLPFEFIEQALKNRHQIIGSTMLENAKSSSWNSNIFKKECGICHSPIVSDLEVHNLVERHTAVNGLLADGTHMNHASNLIVICSKCHDEVHNEKVEIGPVQITSDGPERVIHATQTQTQSQTQTLSQPSDKKTKTKSKGKWTDEEMEIITDTLKKYVSLSLSKIRAQLSSKHSIEISESVLRRFRGEL
jgi:DNA mismatch repair protein MutS